MTYELLRWVIPGVAGFTVGGLVGGLFFYSMGMRDGSKEAHRYFRRRLERGGAS